jgi:hypothetical protein
MNILLLLWLDDRIPELGKSLANQSLKSDITKDDGIPPPFFVLRTGQIENRISQFGRPLRVDAILSLSYGARLRPARVDLEAG